MAAREIVISVRLDRGSVHVLDLLIGSGVARSRSEATARLVQIGIGASSKLLEAAKEIASKARRLRDEFGSPDEAFFDDHVESADRSEAGSNQGITEGGTEYGVEIGGAGGVLTDAGSNAASAAGADTGKKAAAMAKADAGREVGAVAGNRAGSADGSTAGTSAENEAFLRPYREAAGKYQAASPGTADDVFWAATLPEPDLIRRMLKEAPDLVHRHDEYGWTPLHLAALFERPRTVSVLLGAGADPDVKSANTLAATPLHAAALSRSEYAADALLLRGADVNARQSNGWTPLHVAAFTGDPRMVDLLMKYGADPWIRSVKGETPFDIAIAQGRSRIARLLTGLSASFH